MILWTWDGEPPGFAGDLQVAMGLNRLARAESLLRRDGAGRPVVYRAVFEFTIPEDGILDIRNGVITETEGRL